MIFFSRFTFTKMPYVYIGNPSVYKGKRLFNILCQLKKFGQGRIVYRSTEQDHPKPSFYRILLAQPEMDDKLHHGRVVAERVHRGLRRIEPFNLSEEAKFPDFNLVPMEEEEEFCRWDQVKDFVLERDAEPKPKFIEMPPLLKMYIKQRTQLENESSLKPSKVVDDSDLVLPAHEIYTEEHRLEDRIEPNCMEHYLSGRFASYQDFDMILVPTDEWNYSRQKSRVGYRAWLSKLEGTKEFKLWREQQEKN